MVQSIEEITKKQARVLNWIACDPEFEPASMDGAFKQWVLRGITSFCLLWFFECNTHAELMFYVLIIKKKRLNKKLKKTKTKHNSLHFHGILCHVFSCAFFLVMACYVAQIVVRRNELETRKVNINHESISMSYHHKSLYTSSDINWEWALHSIFKVEP